MNIGNLIKVAISSLFRNKMRTALTMLGEKAMNHESGVLLLDLNNTSRYVAYAPMTTTGWSVFVILSQAEVDGPTAQLQADLDRISGETATEAERYVKLAMLMLLAVLVIALIVALISSLVLSRRIVTPIQILTEKVRQIEGDNLDFHWDLETRDETQVLAHSFKSLTERMKEHIKDIQVITVALTGETGGKMKELADVLLNVPSTDTPRIQESHIMIGHIICEIVEATIFPHNP